MQTFQELFSDTPLSQLDESFFVVLAAAWILGMVLLLTLQWAARNLGLWRATALQAAFFVTVLVIAQAGRDVISAGTLVYAGLMAALFFGVSGMLLSLQVQSLESISDTKQNAAVLNLTAARRAQTTATTSRLEEPAAKQQSKVA
ncbi:MAG TPA: hypothetical protein VM009_07885 [Terriglobales bacterium]|nr:hypothetical protein [Terriglobales bacterium]